jgi:hypothetical protein
MIVRTYVLTLMLVVLGGASTASFGAPALLAASQKHPMNTEIRDPELDEVEAEATEKQIRKLKAQKSARYAVVLHQYIITLCQHSINERSPLIERSLPFVDDLLLAMNKPHPPLHANEVGWIIIGNATAKFDVRRSNSVFQAGFDALRSDPVSAKTLEAAQVAREWIYSLKKQEKFDEVLEISNQGEAFLQTLPQDPGQMAFKGFFVNEIAEDLGRLGRSHESNSVREAFTKEKNEFERKENEKKKQIFLKVINDPNASPTMRIQAMTIHASELFFSKNCAEAQQLIEEAVQSLESLKPEEAARSYSAFGDVYKELSKCGKANKGEELLWRLIRIRVRLGLDDESRYTCFGGARAPDAEIKWVLSNCNDMKLKAEMQAKYSVILKSK